MTTATSLTDYGALYRELWSRASEFAAPPAKAVLDIEPDSGTWHIETFSVLVLEGGLVRERLTLQADGDFRMTTRSFSPVDGKAISVEVAPMTFDYP